MKSDFPDYIPDMDHDGKITSMDSALFHEMLDEDLKDESSGGGTTHRSGRTQTTGDSFAKWTMILICGGYLSLLVKGVLPVNIFTVLLALVFIGGVLGLLNQ